MVASIHRFASALALAALLACGPKVDPGRPTPGAGDFELDDPALAQPTTGASSGDDRVEATDVPVKAKEGSVARAELLKVLDQGPAAFLAGVELSPFFREQRFAGWEIVKFWPADPRFAAVDLQPGDVITTVNGREIMKPQHFFEVWSELRDASEIVVKGQRANVRFELRFRVVDGP